MENTLIGTNTDEVFKTRNISSPNLFVLILYQLNCNLKTIDYIINIFCEKKTFFSTWLHLSYGDGINNKKSAQKSLKWCVFVDLFASCLLQFTFLAQITRVDFAIKIL